MKLTFFFLVLFAISSCANQARHRGPNFSDIEESESDTTIVEKESTKSKSEDRATKGEIELGLKGETTETTIIDSVEEIQPSAEGFKEVVKSEPQKLRLEKKAEKPDCIPGLKAPEKGQKPPLGWNKRCDPLKPDKPKDDSELIINAPE